MVIVVISTYRSGSQFQRPRPTPFIAMRDQLIASGRAEQHHILPKSGWVSFYLGKEGGVQEAIRLLRLSYELAVKQRGDIVSSETDFAKAE